MPAGDAVPPAPSPAGSSNEDLIRQIQLLTDKQQASEEALAAAKRDFVQQLADASRQGSAGMDIDEGRGSMVAKKPKSVLPNIDLYNGEDKAMYPPWAMKLEAKLDIDGASIGGEKEKVWYGFGRLTDKAAAAVFPWVHMAKDTELFTVEEFIAQLDSAFRDERMAEKALMGLHRLRQGSTYIQEHINKTNRLILEANAHNWEDRQKKNILKASLSSALVQAMVPVVEPSTYKAYCDKLIEISDKVQEAKDITQKRNQWSSSKYEKPSVSSVDENAMDWTATKSAKNQDKHKKRKYKEDWGTPAQIKERQDNGDCLRCGEEGHFVKDCKADLKKRKIKATKEKQPKEEKKEKGKKTKPKKKVEDSDTESASSESSSEDQGKA